MLLLTSLEKMLCGSELLGKARNALTQNLVMIELVMWLSKLVFIM